MHGHHQGQFEGMETPAHLSQPVEEDEHSKRLREIGMTAPMMIRAPGDALHDLADTGEFLTQHDTGTSQGMLDPDYREDFERKTWGPGARPIYGYMSHGEARDHLYRTREYENIPGDSDWSGDTVSNYGATAFELRPHMREHITFTHGDSLGREEPNLAAKPGEVPSSYYHYSPDDAYSEMQVHAPVRLANDVSRATYYRDDTDNLRDDHWNRDTMSRDAEEMRATQALTRAGVPHEVRSFREMHQEPLPFDQDMGVWGWTGKPETKKYLETIVTKQWKPPKS